MSSISNKILFNPFEHPNENIFQNHRDPDLNYFDEINLPNKKTTYMNETDITNFLYETQRFENVSALDVNIRRLKTNFENFRNILSNTGSSLHIICLAEIWCCNSEVNNSPYVDINNYKAIPFERKTNKRGGSILIYVKTDLMHKIRKDLSISDKNNINNGDYQ